MSLLNRVKSFATSPEGRRLMNEASRGGRSTRGARSGRAGRRAPAGRAGGLGMVTSLLRRRR